MCDEIVRLMHARRGHFRLESGHHGTLWLDLERLYSHPERVRPFVASLADRAAQYDVDVVCGPLVEGAFVALGVAEALGLPFCYAERSESTRTGTLFPVDYRIPPALRATVRGRRVALVNDVINAGSAVRGTAADLDSIGATVIVAATLLVLGTSAARWAVEHDLPLVTLATFSSSKVARPTGSVR